MTYGRKSVCWLKAIQTPAILHTIWWEYVKRMGRTSRWDIVCLIWGMFLPSSGEAAIGHSSLLDWEICIVQNNSLFLLYIPLIIKPCYCDYQSFMLTLWRFGVAIIKALCSEQQGWFCQERVAQSPTKVPCDYEKGGSKLLNSLENSGVYPKESGSLP